MIRYLIVALALVATQASARDWPEVVRQVTSGEQINIRPDKAYLLLRVGLRGTTQDPVLLREPDDAELAAYDSAKRAAFEKKGGEGDFDSFVFDYKGTPNLFLLSHKKAIAKDASQAVVLAEVRPGRYVLYGQGFGGFIFQCNCLGTVEFDAPAGVITDVGSYLSDNADKPSVYPELASETNIGPTARMDYVLFAAALVPAGSATPLPPGISRDQVRPAKLEAVGPFVDPNVMHINRLAAIPGVLRYDAGRVVDVATGTEMKPH